MRLMNGNDEMKLVKTSWWESSFSSFSSFSSAILLLFNIWSPLGCDDDDKDEKEDEEDEDEEEVKVWCMGG